MGAANDPHGPLRVPHQPAKGEREAGGKGEDGGATGVAVHGANRAPTVWQIANGGVGCTVARRHNVRSLEPRSWGFPPCLAVPALVRARGGRAGGTAGSSSPRTSSHVTSGRSPLSGSGGAQTFLAIRVRSVWSVRSLVRVSRGGGAVQRGCGHQQSGRACRWAMHGLQNQCSISALLQPTSCPKSGASSSPTISQQTFHGFPADVGLHRRAS